MFGTDVNVHWELEGIVDVNPSRELLDHNRGLVPSLVVLNCRPVASGKGNHLPPIYLGFEILGWIFDTIDNLPF